MKTPFLGCAYYPEAWDESQMAYDIAKMKEAGITCARIGEFAWAKMEPTPGNYDFEWLHKVVDALGEAGISVVMCTPTDTPPVWFLRDNPNSAKVGRNGRRIVHGGRRHCCPSDMRYREECKRIVHAIGKEFGRDKNVIGWQIDNELTGGGGVLQCNCDGCMDYFRKRLRDQYGTIDELNRRWNTELWSQKYDSFDSIEAPVAIADTWFNPHQYYEWASAHTQAHIDFIHMQTDILHEYTDAPVSMDMMMIGIMDAEELHDKLDIVMINHYNEKNDIGNITFTFDYVRGLKDRPFWVTETAPTWNGSVSITQQFKPEGFCYINSWLPIALGGEANMYWLWRQHSAGHELTHGSILSPEGRPTHVYGEIQKLAADFEKASDFINRTKVKTDVAMHFVSQNLLLSNYQPIVSGADSMSRWIVQHRAMINMGIRPDVIGVRPSLDKYKILCSPNMMTLEMGDMMEKIRAWVENGGVWVVGPMTDIRNEIGAHYTDRAMGMLESMLGITLDYSVPTDGTILKVKWNDGTDVDCNKWLECYSEGGESLASITEGYSALCGKNIISRHKVGKGEVILVGSILSEAELRKVMEIAVSDAGVSYHKTSGSIVVVPREGDGIEGLILVEIGYKTGTVILDSDMVDILTGKKYPAGEMTVEPYAVHVLVKE